MTLPPARPLAVGPKLRSDDPLDGKSIYIEKSTGIVKHRLGFSGVGKQDRAASMQNSTVI
jgi:hypothetical protein